ncbi:MAG TPA: molybdopterin converting factor subunit 1 [Chloroflexota bacterium]|nr:molybdopterin converting factor subunit 1 [Chloroflexota bacterium]
MHVRVRFFAIHRERVGNDLVPVELSEGATVADLVTRVIVQFPELAALASTARFAVNREYAPTTRILQEGDEIAFIPPVAGGENR